MCACCVVPTTVENLEESLVLNDPKSYVLGKAEFAQLLRVYQENGYPSGFLFRDHFGAKIFQDNQLFETMTRFNHAWEWDDENGLKIRFKPSPYQRSRLINWARIVPILHLRYDQGRILFTERMLYNEEGLSVTGFKFSEAGLESLKARFAREGWPIELFEDQHSVKILYDNQVFQNVKFHNHRFKYENNELFILYGVKGHEHKFTAWREILRQLLVHENAQGYFYFDNATYTAEGLTLGQHLWLWERMIPMYRFDSNHAPDYCYVDIVSCNWEHEGIQGFGVGGVPHGHTTVELADDCGNLYSVGQYMSPYTRIDTTKTPAATVRACLIQPDLYFPAYGEKTFHRYNLGRGEEGRARLRRILDRIESIQNCQYLDDSAASIDVIDSSDDRDDMESSRIRDSKACTGIYHSAIEYNCSDFAYGIEVAAKNEGGVLMRRDHVQHVPASRKIKPPHRVSPYGKDALVNFFLVFFVDTVVAVLLLIPSMRVKIGFYLSDKDPHGFRERRLQQPSKGWFFHRLFRVTPVSFPLRLRLHHMFSGARHSTVKVVSE
jgi:hypothetical protein